MQVVGEENMPPVSNGVPNEVLPPLYSTVVEALRPDSDGCVNVPQLQAGETVASSAHLTVFNHESSCEGDSRRWSAEGSDAQSLEAVYSFYYMVVLRMNAEIEKAGRLVSAVTAAMNTLDGERERESEGRLPSARRETIPDFRARLEDLTGKSKRGDRGGFWQTMCDDSEFVEGVLEAGSDDVISLLLAENQTLANMRCAMYYEILLDSSCEANTRIEAEDAVGMRLHFFLIDKQRLLGRSNVTLDKGVQGLIASNQKRRSEERSQQITGRKRVRGEDEGGRDLVPAEHVYSYYTNLLRDLYPKVYKMDTPCMRSLRSAEFKRELFGEFGEAGSDKSVNVCKIVQHFRSQGLEFGFDKIFCGVAAVCKGHVTLHRSQMNPLNYVSADHLQQLLFVAIEEVAQDWSGGTRPHEQAVRERRLLLAAGLMGDLVDTAPADEFGHMLLKEDWRSKVVPFQKRLYELQQESHDCNLSHLERMRELQRMMNAVGECEEMRREYAALNALVEENEVPYKQFRDFLFRWPGFEPYSLGLTCDAQVFPQKCVQHCWFEVDIRHSFPNCNGRFTDYLDRQFFVCDWKRRVRLHHRPNPRFDRMSQLSTNAMSMPSIHIDDQCSGLIHPNHMLQTVHTEDDSVYKIIVDRTQTVLVQWGRTSQKVYGTALRNFQEDNPHEAIVPPQYFTELLSSLAMGYYEDVLTSHNMCSKTRSIRLGAYKMGVFGTCCDDSLRREVLLFKYDASMEASVNAKQLLLSSSSIGFRLSFVQAPLLALLQAGISSGDPTIGQEPNVRQPCHANVFSGPGKGKSMMEMILMHVFPEGYVSVSGRKSASGHRDMAPSSSAHTGICIAHEAESTQRSNPRPGENACTANAEAEEMKSIMTEGQMVYSMGQLLMRNGKRHIVTQELISLRRSIIVRNWNDSKSQVNPAFIDRCINIEIGDVPAEIGADEYAAQEPNAQSDTARYQARYQLHCKMLVTQTLTLVNLFGALSGFAHCIPAVDTSCVGFMRPRVADVLKRLKRKTFSARKISKVKEFAKVSTMLGIVFDTFWHPYGLYGRWGIEQTLGPNADFGPRDLVADPQLQIVGSMYCDMQDTLAAYVHMIDSDRLDLIAAIQDALAKHVRRADAKYSDMFMGHEANAQYVCDMNSVCIYLNPKQCGSSYSTIRALAALLRKLLDGQFDIAAICDTLEFIMEDDAHAVTNHVDNVNMMLKPDEGDPIVYTVKDALAVQQFVATHFAAAKNEGITLAMPTDNFLSKFKLDATMGAWQQDTNAERCIYFPTSAPGGKIRCGGVTISSVSTPTIDIREARESGIVKISTQWIAARGLGQNRDKSEEMNVVQLIAAEVANNTTNSGFYAVPPVGTTNIIPSAPQCQPTMYISHSRKVSVAPNTNFVAMREHMRFGSHAHDLPAAMNNTINILKPNIPESLQHGHTHWLAMMRLNPNVMLTEHFMFACDKRGTIILADFLLQRAIDNTNHRIRHKEKLTPHETQFLQQLTDYNGRPLFNELGDFTAKRSRKAGTIRPSLMHLALHQMFEQTPEQGGYRDLCRHYLHPEDMQGDASTGRDVSWPDDQTRRYKQGLATQFERKLIYDLCELYMHTPHEGDLVLNSMPQQSQADQLAIQHHTETLRRLQENNGSPEEIEALELIINAIKKQLAAAHKRRKNNNVQNRNPVKAKGYINGRKTRNDRPGAHRGQEYICYLRSLARENHKQRKQIHPQITVDYITT